MGGRLAVLFAWVNVFIGAALYDDLGFGTSTPWFIAVSIITALVIGLFVIFQLTLGQTHDAGGPDKAVHATEE